MNHVETPEERTARINAPPSWQRKVKPAVNVKAKAELVKVEKRKPDRASYFKGLRIKYGLSENEVTALLCKTCGICPVCQLPFGPKGPVLDHKDGHTRGFICQACNTALARFHDSPEIMERAISYVRGTLR